MRSLMDCRDADREASLAQGVQRLLPACSDQLGHALTAEQALAVQTAMSAPVCAISGEAGSGKTVVSSCLAFVAKHTGVRITFAAPTGAAAKRIRQQLRCVECDGLQAMTVHKLLDPVRSATKASGFTFKHGSRLPLDVDMVVVDESSMVDLWLASKLLEALRPGTRLVLVGDPNQLPPVGTGKFFHDVLTCGQVPVCRLKKVMRQGNESNIVELAHQVLGGRSTIAPGEHGDLCWESDDDAMAMLERVQELVCGTRGIQALCPAKTKGLICVEKLNVLLQSAANADGKKAHADQAATLKTAPSRFAVGDKVINLKNDPDTGRLNGDQGVVVALEFRDSSTPTSRKKRPSPCQVAGWHVRVRYDDDAVVDHAATDAALELAYVVSVHKSQGAEYDTAVILLHGCQPSVLHTKELLYTAVTRAKKKLYLLSSVQCVRACIDRVGMSNRTCLLARRLRCW
jgi:exodeoxyribonuclease V alpha subunit